MSTDKRLAIKPALNQFNGGEISPYLEGRYDWDKYNYSAKLCKNFIPTVEGYLKRRGGSHYVATKKGVTNSTIVFYVRTPDSNAVTPTLKLNGVTVPLTGGGSSQYFIIDVWKTEPLTYKTGTHITYEASATGYITKTGVMTVSDRQTIYLITIVQPSSDTATVTFVAPSGTTITLNGTEATSITDNIGTTVNYSATYGGSTVSGSVIIDGDKTYYLFVKNGTLYMGADEIVATSTSGSGSIILPACKLRFIGVGGGGGGLIYTTNTRMSGGSGAGCDVVINVPAGTYDWVCGSLGVSGSSSSDGTATTLKKDSITYVEAGGGGRGRLTGGYFYGGSGGTVSLKDDAVTNVNWTKKGNACTFTTKTGKGSLIRGASVYDGHGAGTGYTSDNSSSWTAGTNGYLYIAFAED